MAGPVLDSLSGTLLPDAPEFKSKTDKPKVKRRSVWSGCKIAPSVGINEKVNIQEELQTRAPIH